MKKGTVLAAALFSVLVLAACDSATPPPFADRVEPDSILELEGQQTLTGTIEALDYLDLYQEGTHRLRLETGDAVLIQSAAINLNRYNEQSVSVTGTMSEPVGNSKPVLNVSRIKSTLEQEEWKAYENKSVGLSFEYPGDWELTDSREKITLLKEGLPWITIDVLYSDSSVGEFVKSKEETEGTPVTVGAQQSVRVTGEESLRFYVPNPSKEKIYRIQFQLPTGDAVGEKQFYDFLDSFRPLYFKTLEGKRCAGPAKLKCDEGFRCELYSAEEEAAGVCVLITADEEEGAACPYIPLPDCPIYEPAAFGQNGCPTRYQCT